MIKSLRWRLAFTFVALSTLVVVCFGAIGIVFMHHALTAELDQHAKMLTSEFGHAIDVQGDKPFFRDWIRAVETDPKRGLAAIVLFDSNGKVLETYGPKAISQRVFTSEAQFGNANYRVRSTPLIAPSGKVIGYMQVEVPTTARDMALPQFGILLATLTPLMLIGLAVIGYIVSGKAVKPLEDNVENMRKFLADAGHELNTPLSIIAARAESLERKLKRADIDTNDVEVILKSAERTSRLANDLLLLSELEGAGAPRRSTMTLLDDVLNQVVQDFKVRFEEKNVSLSADLKSGMSLNASADDLYRAFANLVENALRYTEANGSVKVRAEMLESDHALVTVEDTGIGIPEESLPKIFDRFYRVDKSRARTSGGTGLGLAIAKAIFEAHGAGITVSSQLAQGTRFSITFYPGQMLAMEGHKDNRSNRDQRSQSAQRPDESFQS